MTDELKTIEIRCSNGHHFVQGVIVEGLFLMGKAVIKCPDCETYYTIDENKVVELVR